MTSIREKTLSGLSWSFIDSIVGQGVLFIIGIFLARLLTPREIGLIGMTTVFIAVSETFVNSGFSSALIRKKEPTQDDYSTVFIFNFFVGLFFYALLFLLSPLISKFYNEPILSDILKVISLLIIINSFTIIQRVVLVRRINFKLQAVISVISAVAGGCCGVVMALNGYGVWSLVWLQITRQGVQAIILWFWNKWKPTLSFSKKSFRELFGFGSKLLISGLIDTLYNNIYYFIIGKVFSAKELGYFSRADDFKKVPSMNITTVISRVTFPVLAQLQDDEIKMKTAYKKMISSVMLITFALMIGMIAVSEPLIIVLIGEKWRSSIVYLQLLSITGIFYPLSSLNLNMLQVKGRSDLFLRLEIIKKSLAIPTIVIGVIWGLKVMLLGMIMNSIISYFLNSYWSGNLIKYSVKEQIADIFPSFIVAIFTGAAMYICTLLFPISPLFLILLIIIGVIVFFFLLEFARINAYTDMKSIVVEKFFSLRSSNNKKDYE